MKDMMKKHILFLDNPMGVQETTALMLKEKFNIFVALDKQEALHLIRDWDFDCVVTEIDNPVIKGIDLLKEIKEAGYNTNVILITERDSAQLRCHCEELGASDFIVKPVTADTLINRINAVMHFKRLPDNHVSQLQTV